MPEVQNGNKPDAEEVIHRLGLKNNYHLASVIELIVDAKRKKKKGKVENYTSAIRHLENEVRDIT